MTITYGQIQDATLKLIDEYSSRGTVQPETKVADYKFKIQSVTNDATYDLASTYAKIPKTLTLPHYPVKNRISDDTSSILQHLPGVDYSISLLNAKACFFEMNYPGTAVIEETSDGENYNEIETITATSADTELTEFKRLITPSDPANTIRLRFTGDYFYLFRNFVLYPFSWPTQADVQQHRPWWIINPPADFLDLNFIEIKKVDRQYIPYTKMIKTPDNKLSFYSYDAPSEFLIHYWRKPTLLTFTSDETANKALVIDLRDDAALIIPYYNAGIVLNSEDSEKTKKGTWCLDQYEIKKRNLIPSNVARPGSKTNIYGW